MGLSIDLNINWVFLLFDNVSHLFVDTVPLRMKSVDLQK